MTERLFIRHFGKITAIPIYLLIMLLNFAGLNLSYNQYLIDFLSSSGYGIPIRDTVFYFNIILLLIIVILFFTTTSIFYRNSKIIFLFLFVPFIMISQFLLTSFLADLDEKLNNYEPDYYINIVWTLIIPFNIIILFAMGLYFDLSKNRQKRRNETKELK